MIEPVKAGPLRELYTTPALKEECIKAGLWINESVDDSQNIGRSPVPDETTTKIFNIRLGPKVGYPSRMSRPILRKTLIIFPRTAPSTFRFHGVTPDPKRRWPADF